MNLEGVEKTMLLTLYAKAKHSKKKNHKFYDSKAIETISKIDYDFSIAEKDKLIQMGTVAMTIVLDEMVTKHIRKHQECTIINITSVMNTRFNIQDNGKITWYNVDLENSVNYRLKYMEDTDMMITFAYSATDPRWTDEIQTRKDVLIIVEGLSMYLNQKDIHDIINIIDANFNECTVFMEIMPPVLLKT